MNLYTCKINATITRYIHYLYIHPYNILKTLLQQPKIINDFAKNKVCQLSANMMSSDGEM